MSNYTERLIITVPATFSEIAAAIGRALDPDTGGERSFTREVIEYNQETESPVYGPNLVCSTPCTAEFKEQATVLLTNPEMLYGVVSADYSARWPDHEPPSLADCTAFIAAVSLS